MDAKMGFEVTCFHELGLTVDKRTNHWGFGLVFKFGKSHTDVGNAQTLFKIVVIV